jgi:glycyl-tRNA synthetase (class II)
MKKKELKKMLKQERAHYIRVCYLLSEARNERDRAENERDAARGDFDQLVERHDRLERELCCLRELSEGNYETACVMVEIRNERKKSDVLREFAKANDLKVTNLTITGRLHR